MGSAVRRRPATTTTRGHHDYVYASAGKITAEVPLVGAAGIDLIEWPGWYSSVQCLPGRCVRLTIGINPITPMSGSWNSASAKTPCCFQR